MSLRSKLNLSHLTSQLRDKRVLIRVDFNVTLKNGKVSNDKRIRASLDSINYCIEQGAKSVTLLSHLGRPDGQVNAEFSLAPVAEALQARLNKPVQFLNESWSNEVRDSVYAAKNGQVTLLENVRFHIEEEGKVKGLDGKSIKADPAKVKQFAEYLSDLGQIYVNDAFGCCHRAHTSIVGSTVSQRAAGFLVKKELEAFSKILENPERPLTAILGGAKVADKIPIVMNLLDKVDNMVITGAMAFTFLNAIKGTNIGSSLFEAASVDVCRQVAAKAAEKGVKLYLPRDFVTASKIEAGQQTGYSTAEQGISGIAVDLGQKSVEEINTLVKNSKTVFLNGSNGIFEIPEFASGSKSLIEAVMSATAAGTTTIIGGGDTLNLIKLFGDEKKVSHCSTGGGASLELISGIELPGIKHLSNI